jgi:hypothetical protein
MTIHDQIAEMTDDMFTRSSGGSGSAWDKLTAFLVSAA